MADTRRIKVLLLADPPAGDKFERQLCTLTGVELEYRRGLKDAAMVEAVRDGFAWVLVMNGHSNGAALKEKARRHGARYVAVPPGWSQAEIILRREGFFAVIAAAARPEAAPLTHRPLAAIAAAAPQPAPAPAPAAAAPSPAPKQAEAARKKDDLPPCPGTIAEAKRLLAANPRMSADDLAAVLRATRYPVNSSADKEIAKLRREAREAAGLPRFSRFRNKIAPPRGGDRAPPLEITVTPPQFSPPVAAAPAPTADDAGALPPGVLAALELAAKEALAAGLVGLLTVTTSGEVGGEMTVRRRVAIAGVRVPV